MADDVRRPWQGRAEPVNARAERVNSCGDLTALKHSRNLQG